MCGRGDIIYGREDGVAELVEGPVVGEWSGHG